MTDDEPGTRSAALQRLWGQRAEGRRGPKPALSVEQIVHTAVDIADREGLAAVSMARIGQALGYSSMALYRHVSNKDELLALMSDGFVGEPPPFDPELTWRAGLERWTRTQVELILQRPWILDLPLSSMHPGPNRLRWIDAGMACVRDVNLPGQDKLGILGLLAQYVLGEARVQVEAELAAAQTVRRAAGLPDETPLSELDPEAVAAANLFVDFETALVGLADPEDFPHLFAAMTAVEPTVPEEGDSVAFGLSILLDGIDRYIAQHAGD